MLQSVDVMLGELLGARYQVINVLGSGGFGQTYIARDTQRPGNPCCVLKHLTFASNNASVLQQVRRLFQAEAETLERLGRHDQIPQLLAYFEVNQEFYLVQEYVEGHPLSEELAEGTKFSEGKVIALLEDVLGILEYVHAEGVIHRDIKPDNLIRRDRDGKFVLIDFGAVKTISTTIAEATGETSISVPIYTSGYGASEQCLGRPQFSSDLYSLGMVAIQALTGMRPAQLPQDFSTSEIVWRDQTDISDELAAFLSKIVSFHYSQRYQSAAEALQVLRSLRAGTFSVKHDFIALPGSGDLTVTPTNQTNLQSEQHQSQSYQRVPRFKRNLAVAAGTLVAILASATIIRVIQDRFGSSEIKPLVATSVQSSVGDRISAGEKLLNKWQTNVDKQEGVAQVAVGNYPKAVAAFELARQRDRGDPETLIYLNNARIGTAKSYEIAAAVPLGDTFGSALEILRGVAKVQDDVNRAGGIQGTPLKVVIANDDNQREIAQQLAKALTSSPEVLGVVGHGISDTTLAAAEIYQAGQLVMVSPLSSAVQLSNLGSYIFRTMPSDRLTAQALSTYMLNQLKKRKVAIFFNSTSTYSTSLKNEFRDALFYKGGAELIDEVDFSRPDFDAYEITEQEIAKGAEVIMLAPDSNVSDRAIQVLQVNRGRLKVLAGDAVSTAKVLKVAGAAAVGIVIAVPIDPSGTVFQQQSTQLWGETAAITWRSALAYDATRALVKALEKSPTRDGIQRSLSQSNFATEGVQEKVQFLPTGDRRGNVLLMTVVPVKSATYTGYGFKPLTKISTAQKASDKKKPVK